MSLVPNSYERGMDDGYKIAREDIANHLIGICRGEAPCPYELRQVPFVAMGKIAEWLKKESA